MSVYKKGDLVEYNGEPVNVEDVRDDGMVRVRGGARGRDLSWVEPGDLNPARGALKWHVNTAATSTAPTSDDLVYQVSRWPRALWNEYREDHAPKRVDAVEQKGAGRAPRFADFMRELFARLLNPHTPKLEAPADGAEWAARSHDEAEALPEWKTLADVIDGDELNAGLGAVSVGETLADKMAPRKSNADIEKIKDTIEGLRSMAEAGVDVSDRMKTATDELQAAQQEAAELAAGIDPTAIRTALRAALARATEEIQASEKAIRAFTWGTTPGTPERMPVEQRRELQKLLESNPALKAIADKLGRLRRIADAKQRSKTTKARDEVHDVEQGADLAWLLPSEAALLASTDEALAVQGFAKFTDRRLLQYALRGKEKEGRGPIVMCFDESGSMRGEPDTWQKAAGLAMADIAIRQRRAWAAVHFSTIVHRIDAYEKGEAFTMTYPRTPNTFGRTSGEPTIQDRASLAELMIDCCSHFSGGGTSFEEPLRAAMQIIERDAYQRADVLLITDGQAPITPEFAAEFAALKAKREAKLFVVTVGAVVPSTEQLDLIADEIFTFTEIMADDETFNDKAFTI
jgi:uncharacterized protein with von Willebrand factor type A (vWA) domain